MSGGEHLRDVTRVALAAVGDRGFALAGSGEDEAKLRALAASLGLAERVHFLGAVNHTQLPQLLAAADAMVLPSSSEGLANAWIEALACGTPLVITDCGGAREVVRNASAGRIVERTPEAGTSLLPTPYDFPEVTQAASCHCSPTPTRGSRLLHLCCPIRNGST